MIARPYTAREVAALIGVGLDRFYKNRARYQMIDGMPAPISRVGKSTWDRASIDAWLTRHHPAHPRRAPANDAAATPLPRDDADWNDYLRRHYGEAAEQA